MSTMLSYRTPLLTPELHRRLNDEMRAGERIVWSGQPLPRLYQWSSIGVVLFGIPWTAFAIFWIAAAGWGTWFSGHAAPGPFKLFPLFGVPFVLIGFGMLSSPLWMSRAAKRTVYAITNQRAITIEGQMFGRVKVQSFAPDRLLAMSRTQRPDGSGDLIFEESRERHGSSTTTIRRGFKAVEHVRVDAAGGEGSIDVIANSLTCRPAKLRASDSSSADAAEGWPSASARCACTPAVAARTRLPVEPPASRRGYRGEAAITCAQGVRSASA
jgi:hypothetical protein